MAAVRILLLGPPKIEYAGGPVELPRRKVLAMLAYLAVAGRRQSRASLAALLWPETDTSHAHAYVRNAVWVLMRGPLGPWITAGHDHIELARDPDVWIDTESYRTLIDRARGDLPARGRHPARGDPRTGGEIPAAWVPLLSEAVDLYRDDFMTGFHLGDNLAFDEWLGRQQDVLRAELAGALEKLVSFHRRHQAFDRAIVHARRLLALDPFNEPALRRLMDLHARAGQRGLAIDLYEASERLFQQELDLLPSAKTRDLCSRIRAGEIAPDAPRSPSLTHAARLPAPPTPLVGREAELAEIQRVLARPAERLLTLTGAGGTGKTRLALEAASQQAARFADGACFVPLAPVSGVAFIVPAIVAALQAPLPAAGEPDRGRADEGGREQARLLDYLREKHVLLVLDNLEHLPESTALIGELLRQAPGVKVLATSRESLRLAGEHILALGGLPWPPEGGADDRREDFDAVRLFRQEAGLAGDISAVARICRIVKGNPLALEIAASWTRTLSVEEIAGKIESNLDFLVSRRRDVPARHRSIRAVFEHSWRLLLPEERAVFRRLAVFRGAFSRRAAREVAGASLALLTALMEKSLVRRSGRDRFELHELLRQYAEERLRANRRESDRTGASHTRHYLGWLARLERPLKGRGQEAALDLLAEQSENLRAAWLRAARRGEVAWLHDAALAYFLLHDIRSRFDEGAQVFGTAARVVGDRDDVSGRALAGLLLVSQGWFLRHTRMRRARALLRRGHALLAPLGPTKALGLAKILVSIESAWPDPARTRSELERAVVIHRRVRDTWGEAMALEVLSMAMLRSDPAAAEQHARRCLTLRRRAGDRWGLALALHALGAHAESRGDDETAKRRYEESASLRREMGQDVDGLSHCLDALARVARRMGAFEEALRLGGEWLKLARDLGSRSGTARALRMTAIAQCDLGRYAEAGGALEEALPLFEALGDEGSMAATLALLGKVAWHRGDAREARFRLRQELLDHPARLTQREPAERWKWLGLGRLARAEGRCEEARDLLCRAAGECLREKDTATLIEVLVDAAGLLLAAGATERTAELLGGVLAHPALGPARAEQAREWLAEAARSLAPETMAAAVARGGRRDPESLAGELTAPFSPRS